MPSSGTSLHPDYLMLILRRPQLRSLIGETMQTPLVINRISDSQQTTSTVQYQTVSLDRQYVAVTLHRSQLCVPVTVPSPSDLASFNPPSAKPTRKTVRTACRNCRSAAKRCDPGRPCTRCITKGLEGSCVDAPTKRGKSIREESAAATQTLDQPLSQMPTSTSMEEHEASHLDPVEGGSTGCIAPEAVYTNHQLPNSSARFPPYETGDMGQIAHTHNATTHGLAQAVAPVMPPIAGYPKMHWTSPDYVPSGAGQAYVQGDLPGGTQSEVPEPYPNSATGAPFYWGEQGF